MSVLFIGEIGKMGRN